MGLVPNEPTFQTQSLPVMYGVVELGGIIDGSNSSVTSEQLPIKEMLPIVIAAAMWGHK